MSSYLPSAEGALGTWAQNFSTLIGLSPGTYGLMAADAVAIAAQVGLFTAALLLTSNPATKNKATVADKNGKKAAMVQVIRQYAQTIKRNQGISDAAKVALGLTINDTTRTPTPPPAVAPKLTLSSDGALRQRVEVADSSDLTRRAKPPGVQGAVVLAYVGATPPASPDLAGFKMLATRRTEALVFNPGDAGKLATVYAAYYNPSGDLGPLSTPVSLLITG